MTTAQQIQDRLDEIRTTLKDIDTMKKHLQELQGVDRARAEYESHIVDLTTELKDLEKKIGELSKHMLSDPIIQPVVISPHIRPTVIHPPSWTGKSRQKIAHSQRLPNRETDRGALRRELKKLVGRRYYDWGLGIDKLKQINCIADDVKRPLGEALVLLDWKLFEGLVHPGESGQKHLERLVQWGEALTEYRDKLAGEIDTQETRWSRLMGIWKQWRPLNEARQALSKAQQSLDKAKSDWEAFIDKTRKTKQDEIAKLEQKIVDLEAALPVQEGQA